MSISAIVDTQTNEFIESGHVEDARYIKVALSRNPTPSLERYDPVTEFSPKTAQEMSDAAAAQKDADADAQFETARVIKAALLTALWFSLGHQPTVAEIATAKTRFKGIYKALG